MQIAGDMTWERHGVVLGLDEPAHRQVHLVRIEPWMEHDREAAVTHGLYVVDEKTLDYEDLEAESRELYAALSSVGMDREEYATLAPAHRAEVLSSYCGYDDSRSVDRLADALPAPVEEIEFWGGQESPRKLEEYDREMRREALEANFETHLSFGDMPSEEALAFALGSEPFEMDLRGQDRLAFDYAMAAAGHSGSTVNTEELAATLEGLVAAPEAGDLDPGRIDPDVARVLADWGRKYGDPADTEEGIAAAARALASSMLESIGFTWT